MAEEYTPSVEQVREAWAEMAAASRVSTRPSVESCAAEFDRMIEAVRAEEREKAARWKAAQIAEDAPGTEASGYYAGDHQAGYQEAQNYIAARIREQGKEQGGGDHD